MKKAIISVTFLLALICLSGCKCNHTYEVTSTIPAGCVTDGQTFYTCSKCSDCYSETIPSIGEHSLKEATCLTPASCERCEYIGEDALGHDYQGATCTEGGQCTRCNQISSPLGHTESDKWVVRESSTCTKDGLRILLCTICGDVTKTEKTPMLSHRLIQVTVEATCTEDGFSGIRCSLCNYISKTWSTTSKHHNYIDFGGTDPTCTEDGMRIKKCTACSASTTETLPKTGHDNISVASNGKLKHTCKICGATSTENLSKLSATIDCGFGTICTNSGIYQTVSFSINTSGGYGEYQYKYEVFTNSTASTPALTQNFSTQNTYEYQLSGGLNKTVIRITIKDESGLQVIYRVDGATGSIISVEQC